jgi:hypothetical protein
VTGRRAAPSAPARPDPTHRADLADRADRADRSDTATDGPQDDGSAVAEFAMVVGLLMLLFLALLSVALWAFSRTILTSAAAEAARYAANADVPDAAATARAADVLGGGPVGATRADLRCRTTSGPLVVEVTCTMPSPGLVSLLDGILPDVTATGHAAREDPAGLR